MPIDATNTAHNNCKKVTRWLFVALKYSLHLFCCTLAASLYQSNKTNVFFTKHVLRPFAQACDCRTGQLKEKSFAPILFTANELRKLQVPQIRERWVRLPVLIQNPILSVTDGPNGDAQKMFLTRFCMGNHTLDRDEAHGRRTGAGSEFASAVLSFAWANGAEQREARKHAMPCTPGWSPGLLRWSWSSVLVSFTVFIGCGVHVTSCFPRPLAVILKTLWILFRWKKPFQLSPCCLCSVHQCRMKQQTGMRIKNKKAIGQEWTLKGRSG